MTSSGKLSSAIVDFVAPLRLWHGLRPPPMVGFVERVQRAGFQVSLARVLARRVQEHRRVAREGEKRKARRSRVILNSPFFWTSLKAAGPIRASVRGEAPPARLVFARHFQWRKE